MGKPEKSKANSKKPDSSTSEDKINEVSGKESYNATMHIIITIGALLAKAIIPGACVGGIWFVCNAVSSFAGKETELDVSISVVSIFGFSTAASIGMYIKERNKRIELEKKSRLRAVESETVLIEDATSKPEALLMTEKSV